jgi:hypothetical protein
MTRLAIQQVRDAINYYFLVLLLQVVFGVIGVLVLGLVLGESTPSLSGTTGSASTSPSGTYLAVSGVLGVCGVAVLVLLLYSYAKWRDGASDLKRWAGEFGPAAAGTADGVREDVGRATTTFIVGFVIEIAIVLALAAVYVGAALGSMGTNNSTTRSPAPVTLTSGETLEAGAILVAAIVVAALVQFVLYAFATRSHVNTIAPYAPAAVTARAVSGRSYVLVGALLAIAGVAGFLIPYGSLAAVAPLALVAYGYYEIRGAFNDLLERPIEPNPAARSLDRFLF